MTRTSRDERSHETPRWRPSRLGRAFLWILVGVYLLRASSIAVALDDGSMEYPLKLAFLYKFTNYIEWPPDSLKDSSDSLRICIAGNDPFDLDLERELRTRKVGNRSVEIRALQQGDTIRACHIVFIPVTAKGQTDRVVKELSGSSTLTVGETKGFASQGGMINFTVEGNLLHLEINNSAAERAGLKISSKLLSIATIVQGR